MGCNGCEKNGNCTGCSGVDAVKTAVKEHNGHKEKTLKSRIIKLAIILVAFFAVFVLDQIFNLTTVNPGPECWVLPFVCYFIIYLFAGLSVLKEALEGILHGKIFDENFLMALASLGAFSLGIYTGCVSGACDGFAEGCAVMIFYQIGELLQDWAVGNSKKNISELMDLRPQIVHLWKEKETTDVPPETVKVGDRILVKKGEKVPLDGTLEAGEAILNRMALTGETKLETVEDGRKRILSGSINAGENFYIKVDASYENSTVSKILDLVENASEKKTDTERFLTKFSKIYTPVVVILAVVIAVFPPLFGMMFSGNGIIESGNIIAPANSLWLIWIKRALSFLVVSCPCALVLSVPLSFFMGIGTASKNHILIKGSKYLERMEKPKIFICDKTGTLTVGIARIKEFEEKGSLEALTEMNDPLKPETAAVCKALKQDGSRIIMLTGDKKNEAKSIADEAGIDEFYYEMLPQEKVEVVEQALAEKNEKDVLVYVGDGINDAPSLMRADVGISMGKIGTDAALEASDVVLMKDDLSGILKLKEIARKTMRIVRENVWFSILVKIVVLISSATGITNIWFAVFADVGVTFLAMCNALRVGIK
ncbi:MAG: HAD-IC family P-type ATPase [Lachnospiraceae bacterium]|nr:HAD-IC family P-type ATPase [Lachnospiraceae bacterium]